jgi:hypothetical protein
MNIEGKILYVCALLFGVIEFLGYFIWYNAWKYNFSGLETKNLFLEKIESFLPLSIFHSYSPHELD